MAELREVVSETPTDTEHPRLYERAVYIQGGGFALSVLGIVALVVMAITRADAPIEIVAAAIGILGGLGGTCANSLAQLLTPRKA